jgi:membrane-associated phospholipid phosphatase
MLVLLVFYRRSGRWVRVLLVAYTTAMAFTLVYTGAHFVLDILLGWAYAAMTVAIAGWLSRLTARSRDRALMSRTTPPAPSDARALPTLTGTSRRASAP